jgi:hypothetical protein
LSAPRLVIAIITGDLVMNSAGTLTNSSPFMQGNLNLTKNRSKRSSSSFLRKVPRVTTLLVLIYILNLINITPLVPSKNVI